MTRTHSTRRKEHSGHEDIVPATPHEQPYIMAPAREAAQTQIDLADYTFEGLRALHAEIEAALAARKQALMAAMRLEIAQNAAIIGVSVEEVMGIEGQPRLRTTRHARGIQPPKYRGPNGEEWSGRGPSPAWMKPFLAKGKTKADFLIERQENA